MEGAPPLAYRLTEGVVGVGLAIVLITYAGQTFLGSDRMWIGLLGDTRPPWTTGAQLWGAALGLAPGLGLAYGVAVHHRQSRKAWWALAFAPFSLAGAVYGAGGLLAGTHPWSTLPKLARWLGEAEFWGATLQWMLAASCVGVPLIGLTGKATARQSRAAMVGGLVAFTQSLPNPWVETAPWQLFPHRELVLRANVSLLCLIAGAALLPWTLRVGRLVGARLLTWVGQPLSSPPDRWRLPARPRGADLRAAWLQPVRPRLRRCARRALADVAVWLRPASLWLVWCALAAIGTERRWWPRLEPGLSSRTLYLLGLVLLVAGRLQALPGSRRLWLRAAAAATVTAAVLTHGVLAFGAQLSALAVAGLSVGAFPLYTYAVLLVALPSGRWWPFAPLVWSGSPASTTTLAVVASALVALVLSRRGWRSLPWVIGMVLGAGCATYLTMRWVPAELTLLIWWLLAEDAALVTGLLGGLLGAWVGARPALRGLAVVALVVAFGVTEQELAGDPFEHRSLRKLRRTAEAGDPNAMLELARSCELGMHPLLGDQRDGQAALAWYHRAAAAGNAEAMYELALRLSDGRAPLDRDAARAWFARAVAAGCARAATREAGPDDPLRGAR